MQLNGGIKWLLISLLTLLIIAFAVAMKTDNYIQKQFQEKSFAAPTAFYGSPKKFYRGQIHPLSSLQQSFLDLGYRERQFGERMARGDFAIGNEDQCLAAVQLSTTPNRCLSFRNRHQGELFFLTFNDWDELIQIFAGETMTSTAFASVDPEVFAQFLGEKSVLQKNLSLGEVPRYCLDALLTVEDPDFLTHSGVSVRGTLRAVIANLTKGFGAQGGSTITQQLVKNYFLSPEKTISRKLNEMLISLILELRISKDDILETYLNIIYLGQQNAFEVRGYASASEFYFHKPLEQLSLSQCSLLAAILNSPGRYNPFRHPDKATQRRNFVLGKMHKLGKISQNELDIALASPLPVPRETTYSATAPYYIDSVKKDLAAKGIKDLAGLQIFTSFDPVAQTQAQNAVRKTLEDMESKNSVLKKHLADGGKPLEAVLVSSNPITGEISAVVGGRSFQTSPYNRAMDSRRQVGSVFKPIVYLTALQNQNDSGEIYSPLTPIENTPFRYEYENQVWEPQNYNRKFSPQVPLFYALKESMNIPTARVATQVGLDKVVKNAVALGATSDLKAFPSLSLGAFELSPLEVLQIYSTINQLGQKRGVFLVHRVLMRSGEVVFEHKENTEAVARPEDMAVLIGMMKETLATGTGRGTRYRGFTYEAAGKTGTTSGTKDAWFAGFTPYHTAIAWVGYDKSEPTGLTGSSGALPIWTAYMKSMMKSMGNQDFQWPKGVRAQRIPVFELEELGVPQDKLFETKLIFRSDDSSENGLEDTD